MNINASSLFVMGLVAVALGLCLLGAGIAWQRNRQLELQTQLDRDRDTRAFVEQLLRLEPVPTQNNEVRERLAKITAALDSVAKLTDYASRRQGLKDALEETRSHIKALSDYLETGGGGSAPVRDPKAASGDAPIKAK